LPKPRNWGIIRSQMLKPKTKKEKEGTGAKKKVAKSAHKPAAKAARKPQVKAPKAARPKKDVSHHRPAEKPEAVLQHKEKITQAPPKKEPSVIVQEAPAIKPPQKERHALPVSAVEPVVSKVVPKPEPAVAAPKPEFKEIELKLPVSIKDLAIKLQEKSSVLLKVLLDKGIMSGINQNLDNAVAEEICAKFGFKIISAPDEEELALRVHKEPDSKDDLRPRSPIVTFMGHVDHGKTSLLDAIRKTKVADSEHGGITQHIGAYRVSLERGDITFLDTPGHEAFTAMRARGASLTDIVVLVVAADDGIMPQTREAIDHSRAAGVSIIVAINKIDKPQADVDRVKKQLGELNLLAEDWGGKTITVPVSAKTGEGIDNLLEMIILESQMLELKANPARLARGVVVEARISKGKGPVATLLVENGTLHLNDTIIVGNDYGKIRAMFNYRGQHVNSAGPAEPVEVLGISGVPQSGEQFFVMEDEKVCRDISAKRQEQEKQQQVKTVKRISLEDLHSQIKEGKLKELKLILKADVNGSLEAIKDTLGKLDTPEIKMEVIHEATGNINSSDVILAVASNALILGFNVNADERAREAIEKEGVDVRTYNIIYELTNDIKAALEGMLEPKIKKVFMGKVEIRKVFKLSRSGSIAGCFVTKGRISRSAQVTLTRNGEAVFDGKISSLKRFKDDVREVTEGFECGIAIGGFEDYQAGDVIEAYEIEKIARKL